MTSENNFSAILKFKNLVRLCECNILSKKLWKQLLNLQHFLFSILLIIILNKQLLFNIFLRKTTICFTVYLIEVLKFKNLVRLCKINTSSAKFAEATVGSPPLFIFHINNYNFERISLQKTITYFKIYLAEILILSPSSKK